MYILLVLLLLSLNHQHEPVVVSDTFCMLRCNVKVLMIIFCCDVFAVFKISLLTSVLDILISIFDRFIINIAKTNKIGYTFWQIAS